MNDLNWELIGQRLKTLRTENKITIERLSEIINVSPSFVGLVERGDSGISIDNLFKLSRVFGVSVDYLLTGDTIESLEKANSKFSKLNAALADYTESEIDFIIETAKFLKSRVDVKQ